MPHLFIIVKCYWDLILFIKIVKAFLSSGELRHGPPVISPKSYGGGLSPEALVMRPQYFRGLNSLQIWSFRQQENMQIRSRDLIRPENL